MSPRLADSFTRLLRFLRSHFALVFWVAVVGLLTGVFYLFRGKPEPVYQRRSASDWLEVVRTNHVASAEVAQAFKAMGPAGAQFLGEQLDQKPSRVYSWVVAHHQSVPASIRKLVLKPQWQYRGDVIIMLLNYMGTNAAPAIPSVINWLESQPPGLPQFQVNATSFISQQGYVVRTIMTTTGSYKTNLPLTYILTNRMALTNKTIPSAALSPPLSLTKTQMVVSAPGLVTTNIVIQLKSGTRPLSRDAFQVLVANGSDDPRIIPLLLNPMNDVGLYRPPKFGPNLKVAARGSLALILKEAESPVYDRKIAALSLLKVTLPESAAAREYMLRSLVSTDVRIFDFAVGSLETVTNDLDRVVPLAVEGLLQFRNRTTDLYGEWIPPVYVTLRALSQHSPLVIPRLQAVIAYAEPYEQVGILQLLRQIGTSNNVDLALVTSFTTNKITMVRSAAWLTLAKLNDDPVAEALGRIAYQEFGPHVVPEAAYAKLDRMGAEARFAVPTLIYCLNNDHIGTLIRTIETLGNIGPSAKEAVEPLRQLRHHSETLVREAAEASLQKITTP